MIKRLKNWWKNFTYWRWPPKRETQGHHAFVEIDPIYTNEEMEKLASLSTKKIPIPPNRSIKVPCMCTSCIQKIEPLVRQALQGLHEGAIDTESDGDDRISVMVSIKIPPSSDHALYDHYAYEFEKSMGMLVAKCLALSEKYKQDDLAISAFTIEATLYLREEEADVLFETGRPDWLTECLKTGKTEEEVLNEAINMERTEPEV